MRTTYFTETLQLVGPRMGTVHQRRRSGEGGLDMLRRADAIEIVRAGDVEKSP
jgi:hypothetical protein